MLTILRENIVLEIFRSTCELWGDTGFTWTGALQPTHVYCLSVHYTRIIPSSYKSSVPFKQVMAIPFLNTSAWCLLLSDNVNNPGDWAGHLSAFTANGHLQITVQMAPKQFHFEVYQLKLFACKTLLCESPNGSQFYKYLDDVIVTDVSAVWQWQIYTQIFTMHMT